MRLRPVLQLELATPHIRPETPGDEDAIASVVEAAFESPKEAQLVAAIRASPEFIPELSLVAELDDLVVGHVMISYTSLLDGDVRTRIPQLAPLAVAPKLQKEGIGSALVREATIRAEQMGHPLVVLQGSPAFYGKLGFEYSVPHGIRAKLPSWAPPEAAQVMRFANYDPSLRGLVVDPPAFDLFAADD